jgi:hypothetical protein
VLTSFSTPQLGSDSGAPVPTACDVVPVAVTYEEKRRRVGVRGINAMRSAETNNIQDERNNLQSYLRPGLKLLFPW